MAINVDFARAHALRSWRFTRRTGIQEAVVVVIAFLVYFFIRGAVVDRAGEALSNGLDLVALERALGMYWEIEWQSWIIDEYWAVRVMNWIYFWGHMPLVIVLAIYLWVWHRCSTYGLVRTRFPRLGRDWRRYLRPLPGGPAPPRPLRRATSTRWPCSTAWAIRRRRPRPS